MTEIRGEIKTQKLSTLAQLVECLMKYEGLSKTNELAIRTGRHERQIWKAKAELKTAQYGSATEGTLPNEAVPNKAEQLPNVVTGTEPAIAHANMESTNVDTSYEVIDSPPLSPSSQDFRVKFEKGILTICDDLREFWTPKFGNSENLDLALIQAAPYVQENSRKPLESQVSSQLARYARYKLESDNRYQSACEKKTNGKTHAQFVEEVRAASRQMELENGSALQ